jgi:glycosyltransferase involved in cell wall biosynthesis
MNIALIAPTEIPARRANTVQVMKMAQALAKNGQSVTVYAPTHGSPEGAQKPSWEELAEHYGLQCPFSVTWLRAAPSLRRYDYAVRAVLAARKSRLIYTRLIQAAALASLLGIPTILEVHDLPKGRSAAAHTRLFFHGRGRRRLVAITRALADDLAQQFKIQGPVAGTFMVVLPDGVDLERFEELPEPRKARLRLQEEATGLELEPERFTAGYTGHLYAGRGAELILDLAERLPEVQFLLVGGEPMDVERLRQEAQRRGLQRLTLAGFVPNATLPGYQAACDVLLAPYGEKVAASSGGDIARYLSPLKLFEYLACGRPVIASDLPPLREILNTANAVLLPTGDVEAWTRAITHLKTHPAEAAKLGTQAHQDAVQYSWERRAERLLAGMEKPVLNEVKERANETP